MGGSIKVAASFPINIISWEKKTFEEISIQFIMNASYEGYCVEFERKSNTALVYLLSNCFQVNSFKTHPLNNILGQFRYMITRL